MSKNALLQTMQRLYLQCTGAWHQGTFLLFHESVKASLQESDILLYPPKARFKKLRRILTKFMQEKKAVELMKNSLSSHAQTLILTSSTSNILQSCTEEWEAAVLWVGALHGLGLESCHRGAPHIVIESGTAGIFFFFSFF